MQPAAKPTVRRPPTKRVPLEIPRPACSCGKQWYFTDRVDAVADAARLTDRERSVFRHVLRGLCTKEIAAELDNTDKTIKHHLVEIFLKTGVDSRAQLFHLVYPL